MDQGADVPPGRSLLHPDGEVFGAALVIPPVVLGCLCQSASSLMDAGLYVRRRTGLKLGVTLATTAVMLSGLTVIAASVPFRWLAERSAERAVVAHNRTLAKE